ncbi:hypothetical protein [Natranaerobius trueperi]|uniref:Uncharacterized protein n=1 Tax=Natranaerobius trueperi TaxID=759412 RepID=A0A226BXV6_9FIRM|nr:hypothetical protein [Natranaerobius trueperi]OWZ83843.1 hypothetical protein CDO51_06305 [Natranaerobius trueperi]
MSKTINNKLVIVFLTISLLVASPVMAHNMFIEPVEDGKIQVLFDGGEIAKNAEVTVYDASDEKITDGDVNDKGKFHYPEEEAEYIVAEDGLGHRAEHTIGEETQQQLPRELTVGLVLITLTLTAGIFKYRCSKKQEPNNETS